MRSGTSIGANVTEAQRGQSKADFVSKMHIALKETAETEYWLKLLILTDYLSETESNSLLTDCIEIKKILVSTHNTVKNKYHSLYKSQTHNAEHKYYGGYNG